LQTQQYSQQTQRKRQLTNLLNKDIERVEKALANKNLDIEKEANTGGTPLEAASCVGPLEIVKLLVEKGGANTHPKAMTFTPLEYAIINDKLDIALYLYDKGAKIRHKVDNRSGITFTQDIKKKIKEFEKMITHREKI